MRFEYFLYGFKTFKKNAKEIFDLKDICALFALFFALGIFFSKALPAFTKKIRGIIALFAILSAVPAMVKTVVAFFAGISECKHKYLN